MSKPKSFGITSLVVVSIYSLIAIVLCKQPHLALSSTQKKPSVVVKNFWALAEKGNFESASKYMTNLMPITTTNGTRYVASNIPFDQEAKLIYESKQKFLKIFSENVKGDKAEVIAEIDNGKRNISKQQHNLCKIRGEWKILAIYSAYPRRTPFIDE